MAPRLGSRTYGAVDDTAKSTLLRRVDEDRVQEEFDDDRGALGVQISERHVTDSARSIRKWLLPAIGCGLAISAVVVVLHASAKAPTGSPRSINGPIKAAKSTDFAARLSDGQNGASLQHQAWEPQDDVPQGSTPHGAQEDSKPLAFTALNYYHIRDGKPAQDYPWLQNVKLIEPYRETTLAVTNPRDGYHYSWKVLGGDEAATESRTEARGVESVMLFKKLDENTIILEERDSEGVLARRLEEEVMVKYVRREIRTLTTEERIELMDSVS